MGKRNRFLSILVITFLLPISVILFISMYGFKSSSLLMRQEGPCDIYASAGTPCVTAHSTTRALYASYNGPLYQVMRQLDGKTLDIGVVPSTEDDPGGYADAVAQDEFCKGTTCWITIIYDQSGHGNHLMQAPPGTFKGPDKGGFNTLPIADMAPITIMGHKAYGAYIMPGMGLRNNNATGVAINDEPQGIYMVFDGTHYDNGCCFNYGNTSTNSRAVGRGTMSTVYFGSSTVWGSGSGTGPWIMSDMEAGLFSGYNTHLNIENPTINSWRFVTGMVNGGGGNQWEIRGGNAQEGVLNIFYKGDRPESRENNFYYPMHKKGSVQMGNGGDNGNGSSGTFYEGVMTSGYPADAAINAVQANIVSAKYDVPNITLSRVTTFTPKSSQEVTLVYTNTTGFPVSDVKLSIILPDGWTSLVTHTNESSKTFSDRIAPGASVRASFMITSPSSTGAGYLLGKAEWKGQNETETKSETIASRIRNVPPVKINEIRLGTNINPANQFIELYNASDNEVDISGWSLINTKSEWAPLKLATVPSGTKIGAGKFYLLGLAGSGLASPAKRGETSVHVLDTEGFQVGQQIDMNGELLKIKSIGTPASPMTTIFVPVSTGPWLSIPAGSTNIPVTSATGFVAGQKIGIDLGGNYEEATVTSVGKASTQTNLAVAAKAGDKSIKVNGNSNMTEGDTLTIGTGAHQENIKIKRIIKVVTAPVGRGFAPEGTTIEHGEVELAMPLKFDHMLDVDVSDPGTGISFAPATRFAHKSGDAVQALGSGFSFEPALDKDHEVGAPVQYSSAKSKGYQGAVSPNLWYGVPLSNSAGSIALADASGSAIVDAIVYGSQQSNSSANGTITSPEIATLEGEQRQGGCIVVVPGTPRGFMQTTPSNGEINRSVGRYPDGSDSDNNCSDFFIQNSVTLLAPAINGSNNLKVNSVAGFYNGQNIIIGSGANSEIVTISNIGTAGGTTLAKAVEAGAKTIIVGSAEGFTPGQTIFIDADANSETTVIASISPARRRFGANVNLADTVKISAPLKYAHAIGKQVSGSGITLASPLQGTYETGTQVASDNPTPGKPNQYLAQKSPQVNAGKGTEPVTNASVTIFAQKEKPDPKFFIYLCFGQSNMEAGARPEEQDKGPVDIRFQMMATVDNPKLNRTMGNWYVAEPPINRPENNMGPVDWFGRTMVANLPEEYRVGVINVSVAGAKIELWGKDTYKSYLDSAETWMQNICKQYDGNPYQRLVDMARIAQKDGVIKGILIHQGESNSTDPDWPRKVKVIYKNLMKDLKLKPKDVPLLAGELKSKEEHGVCYPFNFNILPNLLKEVPNSYIISSAGVQGIPDKFHFNTAGMRELGRRYGVKMLEIQGFKYDSDKGPASMDRK